MKRVSFLAAAGLLCLFLCSAVCLAAAQKLEFLPDFTIALPRTARVEVKLLLPPLAETALDHLPVEAPAFSVGPIDNVWLALKPATLVNAQQGYRFQLKIPVSDIALLEEGTLLVASNNSLGYIAASQIPGEGTAVDFQPFTALPVEGTHLAVGTAQALYLYGFNKTTEQYDVYLIRPETLSFDGSGHKAVHCLHKIFSSPEKIAAVTGDGDTTFVATGHLLLRVIPGQKNASLFFVHPKEDILELAGSLPEGLFYATSAAVGVVSEQGPVEFIKAPNTALRLMKGSLYILLKNSLAVVKIKDALTLRSLPGVSKTNK